MEEIAKALINSGPFGIVLCLETLAIPALWLALRNSDKALVEEVRRSTEALSKSTDVIREATVGRQATIEAVKEVSITQTAMLGRLERLIALMEARG